MKMKSMIFTALPAVGAFLLLQACGGGGAAMAQDATPDPLEGVWESVITVHDCSTSAAGATFMGAQVFHRGGTMSDTNASPTATRGPGFGTWTKSGSTYSVKFRFYAYGAAGTVTGVNRVTRTVTLGTNGSTATAVTTNQSYDLSGALTNTTCASDVSTKVL